MKLKNKDLLLFINNRKFADTSSVREKRELVDLIQNWIGYQENDDPNARNNYGHAPRPPSSTGTTHASTTATTSSAQFSSSATTSSSANAQFTASSSTTTHSASSPFSAPPPSYQETQNSFPTAQDFQVNPETGAERPPVAAAEPEVASASDGSDDGFVKVFAERVKLTEITCVNDIKHLSVRQLKYMLGTNLVSYKGVLEKHELIKKVTELYLDDLRNQETLAAQEAAAADNDSNAQSSQAAAADLDNNICKICYENPMDCVLLECGHMISCIKCGKVLAECPICRQNIVRAVRVFKS